MPYIEGQEALKDLPDRPRNVCFHELGGHQPEALQTSNDKYYNIPRQTLKNTRAHFRKDWSARKETKDTATRGMAFVALMKKPAHDLLRPGLQRFLRGAFRPNPT